VRIWLALAALAAFAAAANLPQEARDAHRRGDEILYPRLVAAMNEYSLGHGLVIDPGHFQKLDAKDVERIRAVRETFRAWDEAMKAAGYQ